MSSNYGRLTNGGDDDDDDDDDDDEDDNEDDDELAKANLALSINDILILLHLIYTRAHLN